MGKKRFRGPRTGVTEDARIKIYEELQNFRASKDDVYVFETSLSNEERAVVHEVSRKMGMKSKSHGKGENRSVHVRKTKGRMKDDDTNERLSSVALSAQSKDVLQDLFTRHPPDDASGRQEILTKWVEKASTKTFFSKDEIFLKPLMDEATIAKKLDSTVRWINQDPSLRQVSEERSRLPITSFKDSILSTVESHQVVLLCGETGCGKTTQVPQFLLDSMWAKGKACKIVCTQPRRISATSVAERISYERGGKIGGDIGYKIRLETKGGRNSSIVFCTNGVLLRVLVSRGFGRSQKGPGRRSQHEPFDITHIVVDEIHERDRYSDLMLPILRDMLSMIPNLRLILMSATINTNQFSAYFGGCPIIRVPGFTHPVKSYYLEDVLSILNSQDNNHLDFTTSVPEEVELTLEEKIALDDAISSSWLNDEFDMLIDSVSSQGNPKVYDYQHSETGMTPLMVFAGKGRADDISMLLSLGADCHKKSKGGTTALDFAEQQNHQEAAELIRKQMESTVSNSTDEQELVNKYLATANTEHVDGVLVEKLIKKICWDSDDGAILVFLPGWDDINRIRSKLQASPYFKIESKFSIFSLHSMIPSAEQKKVFQKPPRGCRKIILSTNIAETSITIDDVVYVVDSGRMKEKNYDPYNNVCTLQSSWVSKANAKQREGRAGRCQPGICYHLYSKARAASLPDYQVPEIKRTPIEDLCLQVKLMDPYSKIEDFLLKTLDPPVPETIQNAVLLLKDIGALSDDDEKLTLLGEKLGSLPVHPSTGKMLFFAILMNCLNPALTLACSSDFRSPFTIPMLLNEKQKANNAKAELASLYEGQGDQLAVIAAFECWKNVKRSSEKQFCSEYFLSPNTMFMLSGMRKQLERELIRNGFIPEDVSSCSLNAHDPGIVHAVLVAGLYPQIGRLSVQRGRKSVEIANGEKIHLMSLSTKSYSGKLLERPMVVYDEIVRGDRMGYIRNCTVVGPLPVMLLSSDIAVVPAKKCNDETEKDDDGSDFGDSDEEKNQSGETSMIMSSPEDSVTVFVDGWLPFKSTALDIAQIYCLREQLLKAILFKVAHPRDVLPPALGAYVYATACILSFNGLSGIPKPDSRESLTSMVDAMEIDSQTVDKFKGPALKDLFKLDSESVYKLKGPVVNSSFGQYGSESYDKRLHEGPCQYNIRIRDQQRPASGTKGNYTVNGGERRNHPHNNNKQLLLPSSSTNPQQRQNEDGRTNHLPPSSSNLQQRQNKGRRISHPPSSSSNMQQRHNEGGRTNHPPTSSNHQQRQNEGGRTGRPSSSSSNLQQRQNEVGKADHPPSSSLNLQHRQNAEGRADRPPSSCSNLQQRQNEEGRINHPPSSSSNLQQRSKGRETIKHVHSNNNQQPSSSLTYSQRKLMEMERAKQNGPHYGHHPSISTPNQQPPPLPPQGPALIGYASGVYGPYGLRGDSLKRQRG